MRTIEDAISPEDFATVQSLIYDYAGIALSDAKRVMVHSRLSKRLRSLRLASYAEYLELLQRPENGRERIEFINCLTTNKTDFFRESHHFDFLKDDVFPSIGKLGKLRMWSAACSSGEEAYSLAMCVREYFSRHADTLILATDIDTQVLDRARQGIYRGDQLCGVSAERQAKYFDTVRRGGDTVYSITDELRELVKFGRLNFNDSSWPISKRFDVIFCRNAMIYFNQTTQKRLVERFARLINPGGYLIIGHSESLHGVTDLFEPLGHTIYRLRSTGYRPTGEDVRRTAASRAVSQPAPAQIVSISLGQSYVSSRPLWIATALGSCIAACLYDEVAGVGGVNHFTLPSPELGEGAAASNGVHAMEILINALLSRGARRSRLKAKLVGGGPTLSSTGRLDLMGQRNLQFAREFLKREAIALVAERAGGEQAGLMRFHTKTFEVQLKALSPQLSAQVLAAERLSASQIMPKAGTITFF